jgi:hypothetical protein
VQLGRKIQFMHKNFWPNTLKKYEVIFSFQIKI